MMMSDQQISEPKTGLCIMKDNYRLYMKTWAQVLNEADARHKYLKDKLESARDGLAGKNSADEVVAAVVNNTAAAEDVS
jgi:hypothetical protein